MNTSKPVILIKLEESKSDKHLASCKNNTFNLYFLKSETNKKFKVSFTKLPQL